MSEIDVSSLLLDAKVGPFRSSLQEGADGYMDLLLESSGEAVHDALGDLQPGQSYGVSITAMFSNKTYFQGANFFVGVPVLSGSRNRLP